MRQHAGLTVLSALCLFSGLILDTVVRGRREVRRLSYLALPAPEVELSREVDSALANVRID